MISSARANSRQRWPSGGRIASPGIPCAGRASVTPVSMMLTRRQQHLEDARAAVRPASSHLRSCAAIASSRASSRCFRSAMDRRSAAPPSAKTRRPLPASHARSAGAGEQRASCSCRAMIWWFRSTAITKPAPMARTALTGTGFVRPPSTSMRPLLRTGVKMPRHGDAGAQGFDHVAGADDDFFAGHDVGRHGRKARGQRFDRCRRAAWLRTERR